jgi:hypothetical protein
MMQCFSPFFLSSTVFSHLQEKLRRAEALASERETLTTHLRRTLEQQDLRVKQVSSSSCAATQMD